MLELVDVGTRSLDVYRGIVPEEILDGLRDAARELRGYRVLHVNATPYGGGVSELLRSTVPLLVDLGLIADWKIIRGDARFFGVTKKIHNALQGFSTELTEADREAYIGTSRRNAELLQEEYDFVFLHDPQPAAMLSMRDRGSARWIWRCHIDTSVPNANVWDFLKTYLVGFDAAVFTMAEFVPPDLPVPRVEIMPPAIDPVSPKNMELSEATSRHILDWIGVRLDRPLVTQVSRFDPWKDPMGVIAAFRLAREEVPGLQLALVGSMALDDPQGWELYSEIQEEVQQDPAIDVFTNVTGVGNMEVNAFQRQSRIVIQKSIREGFGLVVSEALWKSTPVVAGRAGGIPLQMADGAGGILVDNTNECAAGLVRLLRNPEEAAERGRQGRERVQQHFLTPRLLLNELDLMRSIAGGKLMGTTEETRRRDPVCGMVVPLDGAVVTVRVKEKEYRFCSLACRDRLLENPAIYVGSDE